MGKKEISETVSHFIKKNLLFDENYKLDESASLLQTGIINSTGILELITFIESTYHFRFEDEELISENFDSIERINTFLTQKINHSKNI